jgi:hypothetical protein
LERSGQTVGVVLPENIARWREMAKGLLLRLGHGHGKHRRDLPELAVSLAWGSSRRIEPARALKADLRRSCRLRTRALGRRRGHQGKGVAGEEDKVPCRR